MSTIIDHELTVEVTSHEKFSFPAGTLVFTEDGSLHVYRPSPSPGTVPNTWLGSFPLWNVLRWYPKRTEER